MLLSSFNATNLMLTSIKTTSSIIFVRMFSIFVYALIELSNWNDDFCTSLHIIVLILIHSLCPLHLKQGKTVKMPFSRGKKPTTSKIPKLNSKKLENMVHYEIMYKTKLWILLIYYCWADKSLSLIRTDPRSSVHLLLLKGLLRKEQPLWTSLM